MPLRRGMPSKSQSRLSRLRDYILLLSPPSTSLYPDLTTSINTQDFGHWCRSGDLLTNSTIESMVFESVNGITFIINRSRSLRCYVRIVCILKYVTLSSSQKRGRGLNAVIRLPPRFCSKPQIPWSIKRNWILQACTGPSSFLESYMYEILVKVYMESVLSRS